MAKTLYGKYISKEIIEQSKYSRITAPMINYRGDRGGKDMTFQWSCISQPLVMDSEPEVDNVDDQFLLFAGTSLTDIHEFQAEIELPLGKEMKKQIITEPALVYIPKGLVHGPINFKSIGKPIALWHYHLSTKYSENWAPQDYAQYLAKPKMSTVDTAGAGQSNLPPPVQVTHPTGTPFRYMRFPTNPGLTCWTKTLGIQANLCMGYSVHRYRDYCCIEPVHYHKRFDEWLFFIGGNPMDVEDFDAEIEMFWGKERERQVINSTCIAHVPPGLIHLGQEHRRIGKPFFESINVAGTGDYYKEVDKVLLSREEEGDVMIPTGARDWVPVTRED
jgi:hypothetical protein